MKTADSHFLFSPLYPVKQRGKQMTVQRFFFINDFSHVYKALQSHLGRGQNRKIEIYRHMICTRLPDSKHPEGGIQAPFCSFQRPRKLTYIIHMFYSRTNMITLFIDKGGHFGIATLVMSGLKISPLSFRQKGEIL